MILVKIRNMLFSYFHIYENICEMIIYHLIYEMTNMGKILIYEMITYM